MTTRRITITDIADEFHIPRSDALRYLTEAGVKRGPDRTFSYPAAAKAIRDRKNLGMVLGNRTAGRAGGKITRVDVDAEDFVDPFEGLGDAPSAAAPAGVDELRTRRVEAQSALDAERMRKLKLANDREEGALISRAAVEATAVAVVKKARIALLSLGVRLAPLVIGEDADTAARLIDEEVRAVLGSLADEADMVGEVLA